jgi:DNA-directed DNA polymerase III PolC
MYLNCKTWFSLRYGTIKTEELVELAEANAVRTLALTNINTTADLWDFVSYCRDKSIKPVAGTEIRNSHEFMYILLAKNNRGLLAIHRFLSEHLQDKAAFPVRPVLAPDVYVIYPFGRYKPDELTANEFIGVQTIEVNKLYGLRADLHPSKYVIRQPVTFQNKRQRNVHRLLRAVDKNIVLSKQQAEDVAGVHEEFVSQAELLQAFSAHPAMITSTLQLLDSCKIEMEYKTDKTKKVYSALRSDDKRLLEKLALDGMKHRYGTKNKVAKERVAKELKIINDMGFNAYFLITWDIIRYAKSRSFFHVGRGSGANSIVAYCLEITDVDPLELDLYFERFLNPHRTVPPDFDIDFSWADRDEMIDYIFTRYGREHVCLLGAYTTFQSRAIIRELGKVFGLPKEEIDQLEGSSFKDDKIQKQILFYGNLLKDYPNHLSIHAGGMLVSDEPIHQYTVTEMPPKGFLTSQVDMHVAEKIGLFKLDILSQRGLGHIKECMEIVKENRGETIDIRAIEKFKADERLAAQIRKADTIGCFYIESPAMRQLLQKLRCDDYLTLVAASSIIRPGVAQSGMMKQYIYRYHNPTDFDYLHPKMEDLLKETYGVMVYQEDVIKIAHHFAGLDLGEADVLRRAMSGKYRSHKEFEKIKDNFFTNCKARGYDDALSAEVWRQIQSFGGYSFSKAHSASFAVESYQSLFLKVYYPMEFMVAVINNFGGFYSRELYFHELKKTGAVVHAPCINESNYYTRITGTDVYMGFVHIDGLEKDLASAIIDERGADGNYKTLQDFIERLRPEIEQLNILIRVGAFRFTGKNKKELLWEANFLQKKSSKHSVTSLLFKETPVEFTLPELKQHPLDDAIDQIELLGFSLCNPFELVEDDPSNYLPAADLDKHPGKEITVLGYLITSKPSTTIKNETMYFHTFIDAAGDWLDTVFFPPTAKYYNVTGKGFYAMRGKVIEEFGVYTLDVHYCKKAGIRSRENMPNDLTTKPQLATNG